jgi:hypothetical protein
MPFCSISLNSKEYYLKSDIPEGSLLPKIEFVRNWGCGHEAALADIEPPESCESHPWRHLTKAYYNSLPVAAEILSIHLKAMFYSYVLYLKIGPSLRPLLEMLSRAELYKKIQEK